ncbi:MAG: O-antigen ligase family protein [Opitutaceae bacterium]
MTRAACVPPAAAGTAALIVVAACAALAPRAPATAFLAAAAGVWIAAALAARPVMGQAGADRAATLPRAACLLLALLVLLVAKDLVPAPGVTGEAERRAALAPAEPGWPATARNPALGAAAAQWGALLAGGAVALAIARATAGSERAGAFTVSSLAWLIAAFGAVVARPARAGLATGDSPGWIAASKNGAAALIALGLVLHLGLALRAWSRGRPPVAVLHGAAAAALLPPLAALSSWTGLIALAAGAAALVAARAGEGARRPAPWLVAAAAGAGLALAVAAFQPALARRVADFSGDYRLAIWRDVAALVREYPFLGVGAGAFEDVYPLFGRLQIVFDARLSHPDSSWVLLAAEWGLAPLTLLGWLAWRAARPAAGDPPPESAAIARAGLVAWLAAGCTDIALHRPENFAAGVILAGIAAGARTDGARRRGETAATAAALAAGIALVGWSAGPGARELRWGLLDPARLWNAALADGGKNATEPANLARLRAAVKLQHRAVTYPFAVAKLLHPASPEAAREFWRAAITRAGDLGFDYLAQAEAAFPATPAAYWLGLARETGPDHFLFVSGLAGAAAVRELEEWVDRPGVAATRPPVARRFLRVAHALRRADLIERMAARVETTDEAFRDEAARMLLEAGRAKAAWQVIERLLPPEETAPPGAPRPAGTLESLLSARRYADLRAWVLASTPAEAAAALARICAQEQAPPWFRLRHARALAAAGDEGGAVAEALRGRTARGAP